MPKVKEINFFTSEHKYYRGLEYYSTYFEVNDEKYPEVEFIDSGQLAKIMKK